MTKRALAVLAAVGMLGWAGMPQTAAAAASRASPAGPVTTPYYGVSLSELQVAPVSQAAVRVTQAQVRAARDAWHANTVRLQLEQDRLTGASGSCPLTPSGCLAYYQEIQEVVNDALRLGLTVVVNDTTLSAPGYTLQEPLPTYATEVFWRDLARLYAGNPRVIFDLFNEPRGLGGTGAAQWQVWRDGGAVGGGQYLGFQAILSYVRDTLHAANPVWADGLDSAGTLNGIAPHAATGTLDGAPGSVGSFALSQAGDAVTGPLVYTFHHPVGDQTPQAWWRDFGYLTALGYPVMDGEWNNAVDGRQYCWSSGPGAISAYLNYLASLRIGLTAWELGPNVNATVGSAGSHVNWSQSAPFNYTDPVLAQSPASYERPTTAWGAPPLPWDCANANDAGSGQLLMTWFATQNGVVAGTARSR